ncbi:MAG: hypothetical protein EBT09_00660 [Actinobacteria bacterium]|nr:hypothetical protein [Actinomycetota bacterium]
MTGSAPRKRYPGPFDPEAYKREDEEAGYPPSWRPAYDEVGEEEGWIGLPLPADTMYSRLECLAWYLASDGPAASALWEMQFGKARMVKVRWTSQPYPNVLWYVIPLGNCQACAFHVSAFPDECLNPRIPVGAVHAHIQRHDCPEFRAGILIHGSGPWPNDREQKHFQVMKGLGLDPQVRTRKGRLPDGSASRATANEIGMVTLQSLSYSPWAYFLVCIQQQSLISKINDRFSGAELDYDPRGDDGMLDASPPTPEELEAVQDRVAFLRANRRLIPSYAFV